MEPGVALGLAGSSLAVIAAAATLRAAGTRSLVLAAGSALVLVPLTVAPPASPLATAFWVASILLASHLLISSPWGQDGPHAGLPLGGLPEAGFALLGWAMGWAIAMGTSTASAPTGALTAGIGLAFVAVPLTVFARTPIGMSVGVMLALAAAGALRCAVAGPPEDGVFVMVAFAVVAVAAAAARTPRSSGDPTPMTASPPDTGRP